MKPVIIIPAYQPGQELKTLVDELVKDTTQKIIIVNDGSTGEALSVFNSISAQSQQVEILHHAVNLGKGQALKTAFNHFLIHYGKDSTGVVTADADGQHVTEDILRVLKALQEHPRAICLGSRDLGENVPLRRLFGNKLTAMIFRIITGVALKDTQTGLRGIPNDFLHTLLYSTEAGYDFELDMLIRAAKSHRKFYEIPIRTIYMPENKGSHFNYFRDSFKIYFVFLRFSILSLATAVIDYLVFALSLLYSQNILYSIVIARLVAGIFQFTLGKYWVFKSASKATSEIIKYIVLVAVLMTLSYGLISPMVEYLNLSPYLAKIIAEGFIFLLSFAAQNLFVYSSRIATEEKTDWDTYYNAPFKTSFFSRRFTEKKLHQLIEKFGAKSISSICELGGGNSYFYQKLREVYPESFYTIIDNNQRGLDIFLQQHSNDDKVKVYNDNVIMPKVAMEASDVVFSIGLIEHFFHQDTARAIQTHFAYAKPGSLIIITFPTPTWLYVTARFLTELAGAWRFPDERPLQFKEVVDEMSKYGEILHTSINWPIVFTQGIVVARVN